MPPKPQISKEEEPAEPLHAILLADGFGGTDRRFGPLVSFNRPPGVAKVDDEVKDSHTSDRPFCLLPLLGTPLLTWTLECLAAAGVAKTYVFVSHGFHTVQSYLRSPEMAKSMIHLSMDIVLRSTVSTSQGDVTREVDALGLKDDFLLVRCGYIGNLNLAEMVQSFGARRKRTPSLAMECLVAPYNRSLAQVETHVLSASNQLLHYNLSPNHPRSSRSHLPVEILSSSSDLYIRTELTSIGVDICHSEVPPLFTENFDWQEIRPDFVNGILQSDLLGKTIGCHIVGEAGARRLDWATCIVDTATYDFACKAILARKSYPFVPDEVVPGTMTRFESRRGKVYLGPGVTLARTCSLFASLVASQSRVDAAVNVTASCIGHKVHIGSRSIVANSYIFDRARIGSSCDIRYSIIGEGAEIGDGAQLRGIVVGPGSQIGTGARVTDAWISTEPWSDAEVVHQDLGEGASAYIWPSEDVIIGLDEEDEEGDGEPIDPRNLRISRLAALDPELGSENASDDGDSSCSSLSRASSSANLSDDGASLASSLTEPPADLNLGALSLASDTSDSAFRSECLQSLDRAFSEDHTVENAAIELKTLRMASNVPLPRVRQLVLPYICDKVVIPPAAKSMKDVYDPIEQIFERWGGLIKSLTGDEDATQADAIVELQAYCSSKTATEAKRFALFLKAMHDEDVVSEEGIIAWFKDPRSRSTGGELGALAREGGKKFIESLMEEDEDEDDSDN